MASSEPVSSPTAIICVTIAGNTLTFWSGLVIDCPSLTLCCTSIMAFSMTALPAPWPVISMACRMGTPEVISVPILQAIEITGQAAGNAVIEKAMIDVQQSVKEGQSITKPLEGVSVFPAMVTQMIAVGEETGSLDAMLNKIADFYEDEVNASVKALTSILEPVLMMGVGVIVGTVVISMYLPIFNMMNIVK